MSEPESKPKSKKTEPLLPYAKPHGRIYDNLLQTVGGTPLVRLSKFKAHYNLEADILAKMEFFNPLGSVKDRIAVAMIEQAERQGKLTPGEGVVVEPTSGNTAISLAFICAYKGYRLILVMPESMPVDRRALLRFYGAELVLTPAEKGMRGAIEKSKEIMEEHEGAFMPAQFENEISIQVHHESTAEEIWADTQGKVDVFVAGVGTGATMTGVAEVLKGKKDSVRAYAVEPKDSPILSGGDPGPHKIQGIGAGFVSDLIDFELIDGIVQVTNADTFEMARSVAKLEGIPCGISSGATLWAAVEVARMPENKGKMIVAMVSSYAERYATSGLFDGLV